MNGSTSSRDRAIDCAKGLGILLVVYGHVARGLHSAGLLADPSLHLLLDRLLYAFHMPLFFFLSGLLFPGALARHGAQALVVQRIGTVFYPYVVWSLIQGSIEVALSGATNGSTTPADVLQFLVRPRAHLWFLYVLMACTLLAALVYRAGADWRALLVAPIAAWLSVTGSSPIDLYAFNALTQWFVHFALGVLCANLPRMAGRGQPLLVLIAVAMFAVADRSAGFSDAGDIASRCAGIAQAAAGIAATIALCAMARGRLEGVLSFLGQRSLEVFLAHVIAGSGMRIVLQKGLGVVDPLVHLVLGIGAAVLLPLILARLCQRAAASRLLFGAPLGRPVRTLDAAIGAGGDRARAESRYRNIRSQ